MSEQSINELEEIFEKGEAIQMEYRKLWLSVEKILSSDFSKLSPEIQTNLDSLLQFRLKRHRDYVEDRHNEERYLYSKKNELCILRDRSGRNSASKPDSGFGSREIPSGLVDIRKSGPLQHEEQSIKPIPETDVPDGCLTTLTSDLKLSEGKREFGTQTEPVSFKDETLPKCAADDESLAERRRPAIKRQTVPIEDQVPAYIQDQYRKFNEYLPLDDVNLLNNQAEYSNRQRNSKE